MRTEAYDIPVATAAAVNRARRENRPVLAVGTTVVRALEDAAEKNSGGSEIVSAGRAEARIFSCPAVSCGGSVVDQFPLAAIEPARAGGCLCRPRKHAACVSSCLGRRVPVLQLRRLHADPLTRNSSDSRWGAHPARTAAARLFMMNGGFGGGDSFHALPDTERYTFKPDGA